MCVTMVQQHATKTLVSHEVVGPIWFPSLWGFDEFIQSNHVRSTEAVSGEQEGPCVTVSKVRHADMICHVLSWQLPPCLRLCDVLIQGFEIEQ
jgi:hypothetical protein